MKMTLQKFLTFCTEEERKEEITLYICTGRHHKEIISFSLSDIIFYQDTKKIKDCKINGVEAPENIEALNVLITEEMTSWNKNTYSDGFSVDIELFYPSTEYLNDLDFFENIEEGF